MAESSEKWDVIVIGSGAGGGPMAFVLANAGLRVLVLEKGSRLGPEQLLHDEITRARQRHAFVPSVQADPHVVVTEGGEPELSDLGWIGSCVGGGTARMGGYFYRFVPDDFRMRSRFGAFEENADWPYSFADLEPYYVEAEWQVGVSGGSGPLDGPRSKPLPMPAVQCHPMAEEIDRACERLGMSSYSTPRAVATQPFHGRPACSYCAVCGDYGCPTGSRGSSHTALLDRAEATGRCEVRPRSMVREITVDKGGRVTGCIYLDEHDREHRVTARVVCLSCSAVESARLLLMSQSPLFPDGLANGNGCVGRHLQLHSGSMGRGSFEPESTPIGDRLFDADPYLGRSVMDHYFLPEKASDLPKGGILRFGFTSPEPIAGARSVAFRDGEARWGERLMRDLQHHFLGQREIHFEVFHDFVPNRGTFVELDPQVKDRWGLPVARIHLDSIEHHRKAGRFLVDRGLEILEAMGAVSTGEGAIGRPTRVHLHGTCRAGNDPETSVLDAYCRSHEVPNLFVVDGSFMPTSGGAAPTLTILANSFRTAHHVERAFRRGEFH